MHALLHSVPPALQQATVDPCLCWRLLDTYGQVWVTLVGSLLLSPRFCLCCQEFVSQSCVSSGSPMIRLITTSSKRAYGLPRPAAPRAPAPEAVRCWPIPPQDTLSPLDCKEIQPVHPKGNQSWIFFWIDAEAETPIFWPHDVKSWLIWKDPDAGKDWRQEKGKTEDEMVGWHHWLIGHEFE